MTELNNARIIAIPPKTVNFWKWERANLLNTALLIKKVTFNDMTVPRIADDTRQTWSGSVMINSTTRGRKLQNIATRLARNIEINRTLSSSGRLSARLPNTITMPLKPVKAIASSAMVYKVSWCSSTYFELFCTTRNLNSELEKLCGRRLK